MCPGQLATWGAIVKEGKLIPMLCNFLDFRTQRELMSVCIPFNIPGPLPKQLIHLGKDKQEPPAPNQLKHENALNL